MNLKPHDFIWVMHFLKKYLTAKDLGNRQNGCTKQSMERSWKYIEAIKAMKERKVHNSLSRKFIEMQQASNSFCSHCRSCGFLTTPNMRTNISGSASTAFIVGFGSRVPCHHPAGIRKSSTRPLLHTIWLLLSTVTRLSGSMGLFLLPKTTCKYSANRED